jgi:hypothetical protein
MTFAEEQASKWEEVQALELRYEEGPRSRGYYRRCPSLLEDGSLIVYSRG